MTPTTKRSMLPKVLVALMAAALLHSHPASALPQGEGKTGPIMLNLKIGPSIGALNVPTQFALVLDAGYAVDRARNAYVLFPLQFAFSAGLSIIHIPVGFQYDFALPVKGLYIYPRFSIGYAAFVGAGGQTANFGVIIPEVGVKYVLKRRWNFAFEPFSLPIYFNGNGAAVAYRLLFSAGVNLP